MGLLTETAAPAKEILDVDRIAVVADRGYFNIEDIEACEKAGMEPYVPRPHAVHRSGRACPQRRVRIRRGTRYRSLPGWPAPAFLFVIGPARAQEDQLCQQAGVPRLARCVRDARTTAFDPYPASRTRQCSTRCSAGWLSGQKFSRNAARRWSIHLARSNNG